MYTHCIHIMIARIRKWGNSLGLRIPKALADEVRLSEGAAVELTASNGRLVARPLPRKQFRLQALLAGITPKNLHAEVDVGGPKGRERL